MAEVLVSQVPTAPSYLLSEKDYHDFQVNSAQPHSISPVPPGFPDHVQSSLVWHPDEVLASQNEWLIQLSSSDVESIKCALAEAKEAQLVPKNLTPKNFRLSESLSKKLAESEESLYTGLGFSLLRGLNPGEFSAEENIMIYAGITSYLGNQRAYCKPIGADVLSHVRDLGDIFKDNQIKSPAYTSSEMTFHTDLGDVVTLYTLERGRGGGSFRLASSGQVYNVLAASRPDALRTLAGKFVFDPLDRAVAAYEMPLLHCHEGRIFLQSFRRPFTGFGEFKRSKDLPAIDEAQIQALNLLHITAKEQSIKIDFQNGDMMIFNNLALLHARDKFLESDPHIGRQRHILKLFQRNTSRAWPLPPALRSQYSELFAHRGENEREEEFPVNYPTQLEKGLVPVSGWSQNG